MISLPSLAVSRIGTWRSTNLRLEMDCRAASTSRTRSVVVSILLMNSTCGMSRSSRNLSSGDRVSARSAIGSTTTIAASATINALCASWENSIEPGQSRNTHGSPMKVAWAAVISMLIWRARASGAVSPTVVLSLMLPLRWIAPQACSRLSIKLVLPLRYGPTSATQRGVALRDSLIWPSLRCECISRKRRATQFLRALF
jgi:hypothetical protein